MGSGLPLKLLQWFIRAIQFCCAAIVLGIFAYFLATLHNHGLGIAPWLRAVTGIAGIAVAYTIVALLLLCCLAGHPFTSGIAIILDLCFIGSFIYIAQANNNGAHSCSGRLVRTVFGTGNADSTVNDHGHGGFTALPTFRQACRMQKAVLAVSIVAILFFLFSILVEVLLARHRRKEKRFGPSPANDYTSGSGTTKQRRGLFGRFGRKKHANNPEAGGNPNALPAHTAPGDVRDSYATEQTRVGHSRGTDAGAAGKYNKYGESGYDHRPGTGGAVGNGLHHHEGNPVAPAHNVGGVGGGGAQPVQNPVTGNAPAGNPVEPARFPAGNYQYEDGVYHTARS